MLHGNDLSTAVATAAPATAPASVTAAGVPCIKALAGTALSADKAASTHHPGLSMSAHPILRMKAGVDDTIHVLQHKAHGEGATAIRQAAHADSP
jgi:hypothetical protein